MAAPLDENEAMEDDATTQLEEQSDNQPLLLANRYGESGISTTEKRYQVLLYTSHFLSAWNSRAFEFGAFLFLANIFPGTLLPASVYALTRNASAVCFSSAIGRYIDSADRLTAVRWSILGQRLAVATSCALLLAMDLLETLRANRALSFGLLAVLSILACVEKLSAILNTIAVERDWVVVVAQDNPDQLRKMNAQMRRIDLFCKLAAPLVVAFIDSASSTSAIIATGIMTALSVAIEYFAIARVFEAVPALATRDSRSPAATEQSSGSWAARFRRNMAELVTYFQHKAFLPSFSLALLYLTVLSFGGQMITYLLAIGVPSSIIGVLRGVAAMFELSATWLGPKVMQRIGPIRSGIWFLNWQMACVIAVCLFLWLDNDPTITAVGTVSAVIFSRIGLWGFDLSAQMIVQDEVEAGSRGMFSSQEFAFQNAFEMLSFASTIVFARPQDFRYPATISAAAVGIACILYAAFVRSRRGHLLHWSQCIDGHGKHQAPEGDERAWRSIQHGDDAERGETS